jgi:phosphate transport system substrate-binding protein
MIFKKSAGILATAAMISITAVASPAYAGESLSGTGASYTQSLQTECSQSYTDHKVTYVSSGKGSTTGRREYLQGVNDFGGSDIVYKKSETLPKNFTYVPLLGGPVAISFNLPGVTRVNIDAKTISDIYTGKITKWNDPAIKAMNKSVNLPSTTITPVYRSDGSGTSANFTNYLSQVVSKSVWTSADAFNTAAKGIIGVASSGNSGVAATIKNTEGSIGYVDLADANKSALAIAFLKNASGQFLKPSIANSRAMISGSSMKPTGEVVFDYNKKIRGAYNLSLVSYALAPTKRGTAKADAVREYITYFVRDCAPAKAANVGYVALSGAMQATALKLAAKID